MASSNIIKIKGSSVTGVPTASNLSARELGYTEVAGKRRLFIGNYAGTGVVEIAGDSYALLNSPAFTGTPTAPTATTGTNTTQVATTAFVQAAIAAIGGALTLVGGLDCSANPNYPAATVGQVWYVSAAGKIGGSAGVTVQQGDLIICIVTNAGGTQAAVGSDFIIEEQGLVVYTGGNGINISSGQVVSVVADSTGGANLSTSVNVSANGVAVKVDSATISTNGSNQLYVPSSGITATQIATSSFSSAGGLTGGAGAAVAIKPDVTTGATVCPITIGTNGAGITVDNVTLIQSAGTLSVATIDAGTF